MKKHYIKPTQRIHNVRIRTNMLDGSPEAPTVSNTGAELGNGNNLGKERDMWGNE